MSRQTVLTFPNETYGDVKSLKWKVHNKGKFKILSDDEKNAFLGMIPTNEPDVMRNVSTSKTCEFMQSDDNSVAAIIYKYENIVHIQFRKGQALFIPGENEVDELLYPIFSFMVGYTIMKNFEVEHNEAYSCLSKVGPILQRLINDQLDKRK